MTKNLQPNRAKIFNVALLSFGLSGQAFHAPFIDQNPQLNLYACWERTKKKIKQYYPNCLSYDSLDELLNDDNIEIVVINTPNYTHYDFMIKAMNAQKHIIIEKCFTSLLAEAMHLKELANNYLPKIALYHNRRYDSDFLKVKYAIDKDLLGRVINAIFRFEKYSPNLSPKLHKESINNGSGVLKDLGPHILDQAIHLWGLPSSVMARLFNHRINSKVEDNVFIHLNYPNFCLQIYLSLLNFDNSPAYYIQGTKGQLQVNRSDIQELQLRKNIKPNSPEWTDDNELAILTQIKKNELVQTKLPLFKGNYGLFYQDFVQAIINNTSPKITINDGVNTMIVIDALIKSHNLGTIINLNN